ncbi:MAG TPA: EB domain-containing protein [Polyangia bacterium]
MRGRLLVATLAALLVSQVARAAPATPIPVGGHCAEDAQCAVGSICENGFCTAIRQQKRIIPFYFHLGGVPGYRYIIPLLYFSKWDNAGKTQVQFPFFARTYHVKTQGTTTIIPPLAFWYTTYHALGEGVGMLPLFIWKRRGLERMLILPPLLSGFRRDGKEDITEAVIGLLGYYRRHHDDTWRILAPLFFDHETKDTRTILTPLAYFHRAEGRSTGVIFPLVWHFSDQLAGRTNLVVLPLFEYASRDHGKHARITSILGGWLRDDDAHVKQLLLLAPPVYFRSDLKRDVLVLPPLFTRWKVHDDNSSGIIAGPFFYESDPHGSTASLLPIYWRFYDRQAHAETQFLFPIAGFHRHPGAGGGFLGPIYGWGSKNGKGGWGAGIAPILMFGRSGEKHHAVVAPIFAHWRNDATGSSTTAVGPVFYHRVAHHGGWDAGLFPLLYFGRRDKTSYATLPPIFWHRDGPEGSTTIVGPVYGSRGPHGWGLGVAPILFFGNKDGRSHQVVFPLFFRFADAHKQTARLLFGPFFHGRDHDATTDVLFPLFYLRRSKTASLLLAPLAGWKRDASGETLIVGPYGSRKNNLLHSSTHWLFPLLVWHDAPNYHVVVQFPFFWRVHEGNETDTAVFPIYWRVRSPGLALDAIFPILLHWRSKVATTTLFGPFWNRRRFDGGRSTALFPLFAYGKAVKDGKSSRWFGMPGLFYANNEHLGSSDLWILPFYRSTRPDGYTAGLIPLAFAWRTGTASKVLTPIYYRQVDSAADYALNVLGPMWWGHTGDEKRFGLFPLLFAKWKPDHTFSTGIFPLFYLHEKKLGSVFATPVFGWSSYPTGKRVYVGPFFLRRDEEVSSTALFPLAYFTRDHVTGARTDMLLPLYFDGRGENGRELQEYSPLIWRYHSIERSVIIGLPLFFDVHSFAESRTTGLLPFFVRNSSNVYHSVSWVFPPILTWARQRHGDDPGTDVVVFPFVWHFGGARSTTIAFPFFWDFRRGSARTTVFFPFGSHWRRDDQVGTQVLNFYYQKGLGPRQGSWYANIIPLASFGRPRKHDVKWNVLLGLFGYAREGRNRTLTLFWLFDFSLSPAPASSLSWWSNTSPGARTSEF